MHSNPYTLSAATMQATWDRRALLYANTPQCPRCGDVQIQIMSDAMPAQWRCRICKHGFDYEPESQ